VVGSQLFRQHFDGNVAVQAQVASAIHLTHAASAQLRDYLVGPEFCTSREGHTAVIITLCSFPAGRRTGNSSEEEY
jgi:hypothetical protein